MTALRCVRCHRAIAEAAVQTGAYAWGPKCAAAAGLMKAIRKARGTVTRISVTRTSSVDDLQMRLDLDPAA